MPVQLLREASRVAGRVDTGRSPCGLPSAVAEIVAGPPSFTPSARPVVVTVAIRGRWIAEAAASAGALLASGLRRQQHLSLDQRWLGGSTVT
jgi:hypothetical protein